MKWFCWPATFLAVAIGTTAYGANFGRFGRLASSDQESVVAPANPAPVAPALNGSGAPGVLVPDGSMPAGPMAGGPMSSAPCNCGNGNYQGGPYSGGSGPYGGYMGFSWANGCGNGPSCCSGIWDNYCNQKRSWCSRCGCGCGCGSGCGCGATFSAYAYTGAWGWAYGSSGCGGTGCGCAPSGCGMHHKMRGYGPGSCGSPCDNCVSGCTDGAVSNGMNAAPAPVNDEADGNVAPPSPGPTGGEEVPSQLKKSEPPAPRGTTPVKPTGKTASRTNSSRASNLWNSFPFGK